MITIVDYGMGNLGSLKNMFKRIGVKADIVSDVSIIENAKKIILPGVGSFDAAMKSINNITGLIEILNNKAQIDRVPILGICLGMQLLTRSSEEGGSKGLNWIPATTKRIPNIEGIKVPHMGWNNVIVNRSNSLLKNINHDSRYYFVHSFCVHVEDAKYSLMKTNYGVNFDSAICKDNIYGVQFHPEKSHRFGMEILKNFSDL